MHLHRRESVDAADRCPPDVDRIASTLERSRLAAQLHDGVSQELYGAALALREVLAAPGLDPQARRRIDAALAAIRNGGLQIRRAMLDLTRGSVEVTPVQPDLDRPIPAGPILTGAS